MSLKSVRDCIIVKLEYDEKTAGGIFIPEVAKQYHGSFVACVIDVGPEYKYDVKPGDRVHIRRNEGHKILHKGETYYSMRARWVVAREKREGEE